MSRSLTSLAIIVVIIVSACAQKPAAPAGYQWSLPIYPHARVAGSSHAKASFVLYQASDSFDDVYRWYLVQLPADTPHAFSAPKQQATFALFDKHSRRTVHIAREGASTTILLTKLAN